MVERLHISRHSVEFESSVFIPGELVMFRPSPTILSCRQGKVEPWLLPRLFLDSYIPVGGKTIGQYICCPLSDFAGKSLHHKVSRTDFKLRLKSS